MLSNIPKVVWYVLGGIAVIAVIAVIALVFGPPPGV